jgi:type II secretory pathway component PulF
MGRTGAAMKPSEVAGGLRLLAQLSGAGLPISRIVQVLPFVAPDSWVAPSQLLRQRVSAGDRLSSALAHAVPFMPRHLTAIVRAGERGSDLAGALERAAADAEASARRRQELLQAMAYPALLTASGVACVALVLTVVLPRFAGLLDELGQELPPATRILLAAAHYAPLVLAALAALAVLVAFVVRIARQEPGVARQLDESLLRIPLAGSILHWSAVARICAVLASLTATRVSVPSALHLAEAVASNRYLALGLTLASQDVARGDRLSAAMSRRRILPAGVARLLEVGEETGTLAASLAQIAQLAEQQVARRLRRALQWLEPTVILAIASFVGAVAVVLMQTIYAVRPGE